MCIIISRNFHCNSSIKNEPFYKHVHAVYVGIQLLNTFFVLIHLNIFIDTCAIVQKQAVLPIGKPLQFRFSNWEHESGTKGPLLYSRFLAWD